MIRLWRVRGGGDGLDGLMIDCVRQEDKTRIIRIPLT